MNPEENEKQAEIIYRANIKQALADYSAACKKARAKYIAAMTTARYGYEIALKPAIETFIVADGQAARAYQEAIQQPKS